MTEQTKVCSKCGEEKPLSEFHRDASKKDHHASQCKICRRGYAKSERGRKLQAKYQKSEKGKRARAKYQKSEKFKKTQAKYQKTEKYKKVQAKYKRSERGKKAQAKYQKTERGRKIRAEYKKTEKGKKTMAKARAKYAKSEKGKKAVVEWRKSEKSKKGKVERNEGPAPFDTYAQRIEYAEEVRSHPTETNVLRAKCTYCGKWHNPTVLAVANRISALIGRGRGENRLYCSDNCKKECPIYQQMKWPKGFKKATSREVQPQLRQMVFKRDDWLCQRCHSNTSLHCHHITGVEQNPIESADIDNCITFCKKCHKWVHTLKGCRYIDLQREKCKETFETPRKELQVLLET